MSAFAIVSTLIFLSALFGYVNSRYLKLEPTVGLMFQALGLSFLLIGLQYAGVPGIKSARATVSSIDFNQVIFNGVLSFLLFSGALQIRLPSLREVRAQVLSLATAGVIGSTIIIGFAIFGLFRVVGLDVPLTYSLLFGALISPTDPIAVLPLMRKAKVPKNVESLISGESLFNDGFGVVVFVILLQLVTGEGELPIAAEAAILFAKEALGGFVFGLFLGWLGYRVIRTIDDYPVEIVITLALVTAGYAAAQALGISGPLAMAVAGIVIGNPGRSKGMSARTAENLDRFWEMVEIVLNAALFVLIGLEAVTFSGVFSPVRLLVGFAAIPVVLAARFLSVGIPMAIVRPVSGVSWRSTPLITWAGLRGAIPVALVLSLPPGPNRSTLTMVTYVVVVFSILVQGTTVKHFVERRTRKAPGSKTAKS
jgi:CPA1 family monovalent cation:H+ antiporter